MHTVLIVEDRPHERRLLYHALKEDYRVLEAADRESALTAVLCGEIDLVVLDLHLPPHLDTPEEGLEIHHCIRACDPELPVVIVSGSPDPAIADSLLRSGALAYLPKPIEMPALRAAIAAALRP